VENFKLNISKLLELEKLIFYIDNVNKEIINLNSNFENILRQIVSEINNVDANLKLLNSKIELVSRYKFDGNRNFVVIKKFKLIYLLLAILLLLFFIYFENFLFTVIGFIISLTCLIMFLSSKLDSDYYFNTYNNSLEEYLKLQKDLGELYIKNGKDKGILEQYKVWFDLSRTYKLFNIKYNFFKSYYDVFLKELEYSKKKILENEKVIYKENNIDIKYQNYLAISVFNQYLNENKIGSVDDLYSLYEKEYGFIVNEDKSTINKFSTNKLKQEFDSNKLVLINNVLSEINICITDSSKSLDDLIKLIAKLQGIFYNAMINNYIYDLDNSLINKYLKSSGIEEYYLEKLKDK